MVRGQLPKAYLRIDPDLDAKHPDLLADFIRLLCAANRQPRRGRFKNRAVLEALMGRRTTKRLLDRGDVVADEDGLYVDGWDHWQEGNLDVAERMRRIREERTNGAHSAHRRRTEGAPNVAPTPEASGSKASISPEPPNPHDLDDLEVLADRLLGHPPTPNQWRTLAGMARSVGQDRAIEVCRYWLVEGNAEDPFGAVLDQLGSEASNHRHRKKSPHAYMDAAPVDDAA